MEIATRLWRGETLTRVDEDVIGPSSVTDDAKAALWLYGWCLLDQRATREKAPARSEDPCSGWPTPGSATPGQPRARD